MPRVEVTRTHVEMPERSCLRPAPQPDPRARVERVEDCPASFFRYRGLGKYLLTEAAEAAWAFGASRVWLHTCSLDHSGALANYLGRGFQVFKTETYEATLPD